MKMTEREMAKHLSNFVQKGYLYFKENTRNFEKVIRAHNYVLERGLEKCSKELQAAYRAAKEDADKSIEKMLSQEV